LPTSLFVNRFRVDQGKALRRRLVNCGTSPSDRTSAQPLLRPRPKSCVTGFFRAGRTALVVGFLFSSLLDAQNLDVAAARRTIPFQLVSNFLVVVNGQVGELDGLKFIVDTGASYTLIDQKVADRLKLRRRPGKITNFNREVPVEWAEIPDLRVGPPSDWDLPGDGRKTRRLFRLRGKCRRDYRAGSFGPEQEALHRLRKAYGFLGVGGGHGEPTSRARLFHNSYRRSRIPRASGD